MKGVLLVLGVAATLYVLLCGVLYFKQESLLFFTNSANGLKITEEVLRLFIGPGQYWAIQWLNAEK